jgi:hypothetical protein
MLVVVERLDLLEHRGLQLERRGSAAKVDELLDEADPPHEAIVLARHLLVIGSRCNVVARTLAGFVCEPKLTRSPARPPSELDLGPFRVCACGRGQTRCEGKRWGTASLRGAPIGRGAPIAGRALPIWKTS